MEEMKLKNLKKERKHLKNHPFFRSGRGTALGLAPQACPQLKTAPSSAAPSNSPLVFITEMYRVPEMVLINSLKN